MKEGDVISWDTGTGKVRGVIKRWPAGDLYAETKPGKGIPLSMIKHFEVCSTSE